MVFTIAFVTSAPPWISAYLNNSQNSKHKMHQNSMLPKDHSTNYLIRLHTAIHGANAYGMPVALTSSAVAAPILFTRSGSLVDKRHLC